MESILIILTVLNAVCITASIIKTLKRQLVLGCIEYIYSLQY